MKSSLTSGTSSSVIVMMSSNCDVTFLHHFSSIRLMWSWHISLTCINMTFGELCFHPELFVDGCLLILACPLGQLNNRWELCRDTTANVLFLLLLQRKCLQVIVCVLEMLFWVHLICVTILLDPPHSCKCTASVT